MQSYLCSLRLDVWNIKKKCYKGSNDPTDATDKKLFENDSKARNALLCGLSDSELVKKGQGKYKGKLPFKCFNYGYVGHFAVKCPHKDKEEDDDNIPRKKSFKKDYRSKKGKSKSLVLKKMANSSDDDSDDSGNDATMALFMVMLDEQVEDHKSEKGKSSSDDEDAEINLEGELLAALEELSSERKNHKKTSKSLAS
ncbi:hypothetical protein MRB53_002008 [Persea americana]|uniref:Uncharacterized protein n=1 Tax=Persea americana TaxID=3435 RepID=A0ACC2MTC5_PERAE|nr:hypothetical protein MRB53_002008 [Persea americana]